MNRLLAALSLACALLCAGPAAAQQYHDAGSSVVPGVVILGGCSAAGTCAGPNSNSNPLYISGSFSASLAGFSPAGGAAYASIAASDSSSHSVALPAGADIKIENTLTTGAYCALGTSGVTATSANEYVPPLSTRAAHIQGTSFTTLACIAQSPASSKSLTIVGGSGLAVDTGGGGGGGGGSSASPDTPLSLSCAISAANDFSTGLQVADFVNGITLTGSATSGSACSFTGLSGWNSGYLECTGLNSNHFEIDKTAGGTLLKRVGVMSGSTFAQSINLTGATDVTLVANSWSSGSPTCAMRVSVNQAALDNSSGPTVGNQTAAFNGTTATTTQLVAAVPGEAIYVTGWAEVVDSGATGNVSWQFVYGTGADCATGQNPISATHTFGANAGLIGAGGARFIVPPGNALCVSQATAQPISIDLTYALR